MTSCSSWTRWPRPRRLRLDADALDVFTCTQDTLKVFDDSNTPLCIVTDADGCDQMRAARKLEDLQATLRSALQAIMDHDKKLDDPRGDGSGIDAESPTGDDYNEVTALLQPLYDALGTIGPCSPWDVRNPAS
jgi:hypothetical protein